MVPGSGWKGKDEWFLMGIECFFFFLPNAIISGDLFYNSANILNTAELHSKEWVRR